MSFNENPLNSIDQQLSILCSIQFPEKLGCDSKGHFFRHSTGSSWLTSLYSPQLATDEDLQKFFNKTFLQLKENSPNKDLLEKVELALDNLNFRFFSQHQSPCQEARNLLKLYQSLTPNLEKKPPCDQLNLVDYPHLRQEKVLSQFNRVARELYKKAIHIAELHYLKTNVTQAARAIQKEKAYTDQKERITATLNALRHFAKKSKREDLLQITNHIGGLLNLCDSICDGQLFYSSKLGLSSSPRISFLIAEHDPKELNEEEIPLPSQVPKYLSHKFALLHELWGGEWSQQENELLNHLETEFALVEQAPHFRITPETSLEERESFKLSIQNMIDNRLQSLEQLEGISKDTGIFLQAGWYYYQANCEEDPCITGHAITLNITKGEEGRYHLFEANLGQFSPHTVTKGKDGISRTRPITEYRHLSRLQLIKALEKFLLNNQSVFGHRALAHKQFKQAREPLEAFKVENPSLAQRPTQISGNCTLKSSLESTLFAMQRVGALSLAQRLLTFESPHEKEHQPLEEITRSYQEGETEEGFSWVSYDL